MTKDQLQQIMSHITSERLELYFPYLITAMAKYDINNTARQAAFLAQLGHESADLRYMEEIASGEAYEGRIDLGNTQPGDGKRYKGRGPIQLTGRSNYNKYGVLLDADFINHPELVATPQYGFLVAGLFWVLKKLNVLADIGDMREITRRINGGYNGLDDRLRRYNIALQVLDKR